MKCERCQRKTGVHYSYGGADLCEDCHEFCNPSATRVYKLSDKQRDNINTQVIDLKRKIRDLEYTLKKDDKIRESGSEFLDFTTSYSQAFKNLKI